MIVLKSLNEMAGMIFIETDRMAVLTHAPPYGIPLLPLLRLWQFPARFDGLPQRLSCPARMMF